MILNFVDREKELRMLRSTGEKIVLIYGRRRVGKTRLIKEFIKNKESFYFLCQKNSIKAEFDRFLKKFNMTRHEYIEATDLEDFFEKIKDRDIIIVLDEFSYWVEKNPEIPSVFQYIVDEILPDSKLRIILSGSLIGTSESLLAYRQPLYGRIKLRIKLSPLKFKHTGRFLPGYKIEDLVKVYACVGGIPAYLEEFARYKSFEDGLKNILLNKFGYLYDETERLLKDELREPEIYMRILESIASGAVTLGEISSKSFVAITNLPKYLKVLEKMEIVKKAMPVVGKSRGVWKINDNYFNFWIRFVYRYREEIELETYVFDEAEFNRYLGVVFEDIARQTLAELLQMQFTKIGGWWHKDKEIDVVALNEKTKEILFAECKWQSRVNAKRICGGLVEKSRHVVWNNEKRKESFAVFAKSFSKRIDDFEGRKVYCFDLKDLAAKYG